MSVTFFGYLAADSENLRGCLGHYSLQLILTDSKQIRATACCTSRRQAATSDKRLMKFKLMKYKLMKYKLMKYKLMKYKLMKYKLMKYKLMKYKLMKYKLMKYKLMK
ncbi:hypothetical protein OUZ56_033209 [Daphnia magna]|uniref:Uncharacterized protein n=1 Tax=Daphnia magna TaxID=35525 RepID=A0ABR0BAF8_9CRUS|nr:hypothetical protein OUZ56_033209 [Daphnia magna]